MEGGSAGVYMWGGGGEGASGLFRFTVGTGIPTGTPDFKMVFRKSIDLYIFFYKDFVT